MPMWDHEIIQVHKYYLQLFSNGAVKVNAFLTIRLTLLSVILHQLMHLEFFGYAQQEAIQVIH